MKSRENAGKISEIEKEFQRGRYARVLELSIDSITPRLPVADLSWVIGALSFLGRVEEAELLLASKIAGLPIAQRIGARFFLGIGCSRESRHDRAREYFGLNLRERRRKLDGELLFYAYQGLSFNRYFSGRFRAAAQASTQAFEAATRAGFLYGKALSADMRGHILIQCGEVSAGLRILEQAMRFARLLDNEAIRDAIQISKIIYAAQFGMNPRRDVAALKRALATLRPGDNYSQSNILLELARQFLLRGCLCEAARSLDQAAVLVHGTRNRRHEVLLNVRYADMYISSGEPARALTFLSLAKRSLNPAVDHALELTVLGIERKALGKIGNPASLNALDRRLEQMAGIYGNFIQRRMNERQLGHASAPERPAEDRLGELKDSISLKSPSALENILATGYLSLLPEVLDVPLTGSLICVELLPGTLTVVDRGEIRHSSGLTPLSRSLLLQITRGRGSKRQLIERIWGYEYHPLRHDPIIYSAVNGLRKLLGERASWIELTEGGYRLATGVKLRASASAAKASEVDSAVISESSLNLRQYKILRHLEKYESVDVRTCRRLFDVSEITASRDLSGLSRDRYVLRVGRGRATQYVLANTALRRSSR